MMVRRIQDLVVVEDDDDGDGYVKQALNRTSSIVDQVLLLNRTSGVVDLCCHRYNA